MSGPQVPDGQALDGPVSKEPDRPVSGPQAPDSLVCNEPDRPVSISAGWSTVVPSGT